MRSSLAILSFFSFSSSPPPKALLPFSLSFFFQFESACGMNVVSPGHLRVGSVRLEGFEHDLKFELSGCRCDYPWRVWLDWFWFAGKLSLLRPNVS